ncbi:MAG: c-type cytochrome [Myxococcaceae bacterium]|nr:c-type cytochrome [Myxococcaceae bacterium]
MRNVAVASLCALLSCGARGVVLSPNDEVRREQCRAAHPAPAVAPLFAEGASATGPIVTRRADGVIVTTIAGRVRGRHEREERFGSFDGRSFENRGYQLVIEDAVAAGRSELVVTYRPGADVSQFGPSTTLRTWKMYGPAGNQNGGYTFHVNQTMQQRAPRELVHTVTRNARADRAMQAGDIFDFELGIYLAGASASDPMPIAGGSAYFSDTFRYQVGIGGLTPETFDHSGVLGPPLEARLGGATTVPFVALADGTVVEPQFALSQLALNVQAPNHQTWLEGRRLFHTDFETGAHAEGGNPPAPVAGVLGPLFNAKSCVGCHPFNARGSLPDAGEPVQALVLKLEGEVDFGGQLQPQELEARLTRFETSTVALEGGERAELSKPVFEAGRALRASPRLAPALVGLGLLEAVDEATVLERADEADCDEDGISGRAALSVGRLGRFGLKASHATVREQVVAELDAHLGVTTAELAAADVDRLEAYVRLLGVQPQRGAGAPDVVRGAEVFTTARCDACHRPDVVTGSRHPLEELRAQAVRPYTDLLLHDLGDGLMDATGSLEWRTAPLWGVGLARQVTGRVQLLHDGRARSVLEAVLWHGGEAAVSREAVVALSPADRRALVAFVESL